MRGASRKTVVIGGAAAVLVAGGVAVAAAGPGSDDGEGGDRAISGADLQRAEEAALAATGGGRVTATEVEDEESAYEVEVTFDDGRQVDVQLDQDFNVVSSSDDVGDSDGSGG
jgi:uncharacterized membrane protein YkoI